MSIKKKLLIKKIIAVMVNMFFINIGSNLADKNPPSSTSLESYLANITTVLSDKPLLEKEFKDTFFTLKTNKSPSYDNLNVNVIRSMYPELIY